MKARLSFDMNTTSGALVTASATVPTPDGDAIRIRDAIFQASAAVATNGLTECWVSILSRPAASIGVGSLSPVIFAAHNAFLMIGSVSDPSPGQSSSKNWGVSPQGVCVPQLDDDELVIAGTSINCCLGLVQAITNGPASLKVSLVIDYDFVRITQKVALAIANQY